MKLILITLLLILMVCYTQKERFTMYIKTPFDYQAIGTSPLNYYMKPLYRKPYRFPYQFKSTYPINHMTYN